MELIQSRRDFLAGLSAAGAASVLGPRAALADEAPPEVTALRLAVHSNQVVHLCWEA
jgi:NitT/TauT family transport system substrate-binding protein